jgi:hypothetical protein
MMTTNETPKNLATEWSQVPCGIYLMRAFHERIGKHTLHLQLKVSERPWWDHPHIPHAYSMNCTNKSHSDFWNWAIENLPAWDNPDHIQSH